MCDLTHDTIVLVSDTIPINIGFIGAYAKKTYGDQIELTLFKYPKQVLEAIDVAPPDVLALSNYSWNSKLSERVARFAKEKDARIVTVQGGTNFPHKAPQQLEFLLGRLATDVYVELEAEASFTDLLGRVLSARDGGPSLYDAPIPGCVFIEPTTRRSSAPVLIKGDVLPRIKHLDEIPSPYLTGLMDHFFDGRLTPFLETNRGCPFKCSFCHTGADYFEKINNFSLERIAEEIAYVGPRTAALGIVNLHLADTNFGMYPRDRAICEALLDSQQRTGWPRQIISTTGKNNKERVIDITTMLGNVFTVNMSVQSMDHDVLVNIKRDNIRLETYTSINQHLNAQGRSTKGEMIIGLPGETRESFVRGLEEVIAAGVSSVCMYSLMLLHGTEFKDPDYRRQFGIQGKSRLVPLNFGEYAGERVFDSEEMAYRTNSMSFEDYLWIRGLCLVVEIMHNNRPFDELIRYGIDMGFTRFQLLERAYQTIDRAPETVRNIVQHFMDETSSELWDTEEEMEAAFRQDANYARLQNGEVGGNLIYKYKAKSLAFTNSDWADYLAWMLIDIASERMAGDAEAIATARQEVTALAEYVKAKLAGILNASAPLEPQIVQSPYDIPAWLKEGGTLAEHRLPSPVTYVFEYGEDQVAARKDYFHRYGTDVNAISKIVTRVSNVESLFRRRHALNEAFDPSMLGGEADKDLFIRYSLSS